MRVGEVRGLTSGSKGGRGQGPQVGLRSQGQR